MRVSTVSTVHDEGAVVAPFAAWTGLAIIEQGLFDDLPTLYRKRKADV